MGLIQIEHKCFGVRIINILIESISLLMVLHQHLVVQITLSVYGMLRQDNKKPNFTIVNSHIYILQISILVFKQANQFNGCMIYNIRHWRKEEKKEKKRKRFRRIN
ncbi:unnamed protein product (macronuclear) [Paramecium tetraurelia]|uniref:Uncharacterized protein n=1 Tax=Paramecium tetraurelia TaxID=5888 RepID=A0DEB1_PARTE|nr:uncharacterized protein GSPATT00016204001 [Paramecium tetraurelia]CAK81378.1 unnamed protein product [Paramecium tetraurelia]|eukprot:XP_001448775.1 hypothetical protein (macronuclear) [Paramecium tetraurelia strain d4-2]